MYQLRIACKSVRVPHLRGLGFEAEHGRHGFGAEAQIRQARGDLRLVHH